MIPAAPPAARRGLWLFAALWLALWAASVKLGLAALLLGPDATVGGEALLMLPGLAGAVALLWWEARRRLRPVEARWQPPLPTARPATPPPPAAHVDHAPSVPPATRAAVPSAEPEQAEPAVVSLGPDADPAYAAWRLRWDAGDAGRGAVVLPFGEHLLVGRDPAAHLRVNLEPVSWHHLELRVRDGDVAVMDLASSNGSFVTVAGGAEHPLEPRLPLAIPAGARIRLADPWAVVLTLEPLVRAGVS